MCDRWIHLRAHNPLHFDCIPEPFNIMGMVCTQLVSRSLTHKPRLVQAAGLAADLRELPYAR